MKPFDIVKARQGAKVCTSGGHDVRILCFDAFYEGENRICGLVKIDDSHEHPHLWKYDGSRWHDLTTDLDLFIKVEHHEGWVNVYYNSGCWGYETREVYDSKEEALNDAGGSVVATVKIEWEE